LAPDTMSGIPKDRFRTTYQSVYTSSSDTK
jgi:hypothetical protein